MLLSGANGRASKVLSHSQLAWPPLPLPRLVQQPRLGARCSPRACPAGICSFFSSFYSSFSSIFCFSSSSSIFSFSSFAFAGATRALGCETLFHACTLALAHRCLPCKYIGTEIRIKSIKIEMKDHKVLQSGVKRFLTQVWGWLLYFISVHSCPQPSIPLSGNVFSTGLVDAFNVVKDESCNQKMQTLPMQSNVTYS